MKLAWMTKWCTSMARNHVNIIMWLRNEATRLQETHPYMVLYEMWQLVTAMKHGQMKKLGYEFMVESTEEFGLGTKQPRVGVAFNQTCEWQEQEDCKEASEKIMRAQTDIFSGLVLAARSNWTNLCSDQRDRQPRVQFFPSVSSPREIDGCYWLKGWFDPNRIGPLYMIIIRAPATLKIVPSTLATPSLLFKWTSSILQTRFKQEINIIQ